jgi:peptide-methionine (S)-S-oxide reductase
MPPLPETPGLVPRTRSGQIMGIVNTKETATFAGGCFWCTEAIFKNLKGVISVMPGYTGGHVPNPSYEQVCAGTTGHAEATQIEFDPSVIPFERLLDVFFATHDPTTLNRQGHDVGEQYRSAVFYQNEEQRVASEEAIKNLEQDKTFSNPIVTQIVPFTDFYPAEDYHRDYYARNKFKPYCLLTISPKLAKLRKKFSSYLT